MALPWPQPPKICPPGNRSIAFSNVGSPRFVVAFCSGGDAGGARGVDLLADARDSICNVLYEQIAEHLTQLIRERDMRPGDRLPPERELASQLGVSRPSVREAMIALETAGLVEVRTGSGTYIREITSPGAFVYRGPPRTMRATEVRETGTGARKLIELQDDACGGGVNHPDVEIDALAAAIDRAERRFVNGQTAEEDDYFFHVSLAESTRNTVLAGLVRHLWDLRRSEMWSLIRTRCKSTTSSR